MTSPAAQAAPSAAGNARSTIDGLRAHGYTVIVTKAGDEPLDDATVIAIRPGHTFSRTDHGAPGGDLVTTVIERTIWVDVT
jgi:hypothetical protein